MITILNLLILVLIGFIIWWFWMYKPKTTKVIEKGEVTITIENGVYKPDRIAAYVGQPLTIRFILKDDSHCAKKVLLPDFDMSVELNQQQPTELKITPNKTGEFNFACPMAMYQGTLEVKDAPGIDIIIDKGVYQPNLIEVETGKSVNLRFTRLDPSRCAQTVIFPDFDIAEEIGLNEPKTITILPEESKEYHFSCEMGMYQGKIISK